MTAWHRCSSTRSTFNKPGLLKRWVELKWVLIQTETSQIFLGEKMRLNPLNIKLLIYKTKTFVQLDLECFGSLAKMLTPAPHALHTYSSVRLVIGLLCWLYKRIPPHSHTSLAGEADKIVSTDGTFDMNCMILSLRLSTSSTLFYLSCNTMCISNNFWFGF